MSAFKFLLMTLLRKPLCLSFEFFLSVRRNSGTEPTDFRLLYGYTIIRSFLPNSVILAAIFIFRIRLLEYIGMSV